jgi:hypothetical protein
MTDAVHWDENCLHVTIKGLFTKIKVRDAIFDVECSVEEEDHSSWTHLVNCSDCVEGDYEAKQMLHDLQKVYDNKGCCAIAFVISEDKLSNYIDAPILSDDANNGVRLFYCEQSAIDWLAHQSAIHRKRSLH